MRKKWKKFLPVAGAGIIAALAVVIMVPVNAESRESDTIPGKVYIGDIAVGGMKKEEATAAVESYVTGLQGSKITIQAGENTVETTAADLGVSWKNKEIVEEAAGLGRSGNLISRYKAMKDLEKEDKVYNVAYAVDRVKVQKVLEDNAASLNTEAVNAGLKRENNAFTVIPGSQGVVVNMEESLKSVETYFSTEWKGSDGTVEIVADVSEPKGTEEELSKVKDLLGGFQTSYGTSGANRSQNVSNGTEKINGSVIYPGDEFSVYGAVNPFSAENGYELAGSYENGTTVETYGGGICQVSTTLYNAVIRAELEVTERFNHSMIVSYVDPSADAAIAGTYKDLKFKNNTDAPIYIEGYTAGKVVYFNIFGHETRDSGRKIEFVSETLSTTDPGVEYKEAPDQPIGYIHTDQGSHVGYTAQLWKVITLNGAEQSRDVFNKSTYKASPKIVLVGTASANAEASNAVRGAIASQDEGTINAASAQWNDSALAAQAQAQADALAQQQQQQQEEEQKKKEEDSKKDNENSKDDGEKDGNAGKGEDGKDKSSEE